MCKCMNMNLNFKQIVFEGDEHPKVNIICDVLTEGLRSQFRDIHSKNKKNVILQHCVSFPYIQTNLDSHIEIFSPLIPYGVRITLFFEKRYEDMSVFDEIVYMQPYPFTLDKINFEIENAEELIKNLSGYQFKIMFYRDINQHSGAGDLVGIDQALYEAPEKIKKKLSGLSISEAFDYCVYKSPKDLINVIHGGYGDLSVVVTVCAERFRKFSERIKSDYFYSDYGDYKYILEYNEKYSVLLRTETINKVTKFRKVAGCTDVINQYTANYVSEFQNLILELIEEVYISIVNDICFWNLKKDLFNLKEGAKKLIIETLLSTSEIKVECPQFEADYNSLIRNQYNLDTSFAEKAISIINKDLMNYLHEYLTRKEDLLSNAFLSCLDNGNKI